MRTTEPRHSGDGATHRPEAFVEVPHERLTGGVTKIRDERPVDFVGVQLRLARGGLETSYGALVEVRAAAKAAGATLGHRSGRLHADQLDRLVEGTALAGRGVRRLNRRLNRIQTSYGIEKAVQEILAQGRDAGRERDAVRHEIIALALAPYTRRQLITWLRDTGRPIPLIRLRLNINRHSTLLVWTEDPA